MRRIKCQKGHEDGWITNEELVIDGNEVFGGQTIECRCNHLGCNEIKYIRFDITNVEEE